MDFYEIGTGLCLAAEFDGLCLGGGYLYDTNSFIPIVQGWVFATLLIGAR